MTVHWQDQPSVMHMLNDVTQIEEAQIDKSRTQFQQMIMRNVSHEYRTPLNAIITSTQMVIRKLDDLIRQSGRRFADKLDDIKNQVKVENASSRLMLTLVNGMIDMASL